MQKMLRGGGVNVVMSFGAAQSHSCVFGFSRERVGLSAQANGLCDISCVCAHLWCVCVCVTARQKAGLSQRSEEHTSELQSR